MIYLLAILMVLIVLYILSLRGRTGHPGMAPLRGWVYAHRGLYGGAVPENSMAAFHQALEAGYGVELDVHLLKDGNLAVLHDSSLRRATGADGRIEDLTTEQLSQYHLFGTEQTIPQFRQVLALFAGQVPMIIELKPDGNVEALCQAVCQELDGYSGVYCLESFDPRCVAWLRRNRPDLVRGQLSENFLADANSPLPFLLKLGMTLLVTNFVTRPDFIAYRFPDRRQIGNRICRRLWKIPGVSWTLKDQAQFDAAVAEGNLPIFEGFLPEKPS
ncbi:MAG: glycerophosphodiester phosphodiesterase [Firmicutes bacterium]|nr:glycerophosphodiester phosphodiesterase [Bacillota bacterium]